MKLWNRLKHIRSEIKCGRHSGFSWCCILWFILPWKIILTHFSPKKIVVYDALGVQHEVWPVDYQNFYHKLMSSRQPKSDMPDLKIEWDPDATNACITGFKYIRVQDWGMIPCPFHLWRRKRSTVITCFCNNKWEAETKARAVREYPDLCVKG